MFRELGFKGFSPVADSITEDTFESATEMNVNLDLVGTILALKQIREAIDYITERGIDHGWDIDLKDDMIALLVEESKMLSQEVMQIYHYSKMEATSEETFD